MNLPAPDAIGLLYFLSELGLSVLRRSRGTGASAADGGSLRFIWCVVTVSVAGALMTQYLLPQASYALPAPAYAAGFVLFCLGLVLRWVAIVYLGRYFTVDVAVAADQRVVTSGPYRFIRHPSYTGALLAFLGLGICMGNALALVTLLVPVSWVFLHRIRIEEGVMQRALGAPYRDYMLRTRRLIPFVY